MTNNTERINMEDDTATNERPRKLKDYHTASTEGYGPSIVRPPIGQNNFELKPNFISMIQNHVQFYGLPHEDPNQHIANFLEYCDTLKMNGVSDDAVRLRLFSFSLRDKAKAWVQAQPAGTFKTWEELSKAFIYKYFPPSRASQLKNEILGFQQQDGETLYEAWERYKDLLRKCPNHELPKWVQVQTFYNGSLPNTQEMIDAASGGSLNNKTLEEAEELIETLASNHYAKTRDRSRKQAGVYEVDQNTAFAAQMTAIQQQLNLLNKRIDTPMKLCELCNGRGHISSECQVGNQFAQNEQANYANFQRGQGNSYGNPYPHNYNPNWRTQHPNLSWRNNNELPHQNQDMQQQDFRAPDKKPSIEDMFSKIMDKFDKTTERTEKRLEINELKLQNHDSILKNLEQQVGQIHDLLSQRQLGKLPSDTEKNPREHVNAVTLRSGTTYEGQQVVINEKEDEAVPENKDTYDEVDDEVERAKEKERVDQRVKEYVAKYNRPPFPSRLKDQMEDKQYSKFLKMFRSLHINIPFADMLEHMPKYVKFLKELVSKKKKLGEHETVMLTEESSALLMNKLPPKLRDPGNFSIPCTIGNIKFNNALCDLGASVNILPYSLFKKLNIGEVKPTQMTLQLADRSVIHPRGIVEDVLVKVDKFIYPVDLVVLDMAEDGSIPLILGRAFLKTARAIIDVDEGKIILRAGDESVEFHLANKIQYPPEAENCWMIDEVNKEKKDELGEIFSYPTLEERLKLISIKEAEGEELSKNERYLRHLMSVSMPMVKEKRKMLEDPLPHEPPDEQQQQNGEHCFSINVIDKSKKEEAIKSDRERENGSNKSWSEKNNDPPDIEPTVQGSPQLQEFCFSTNAIDQSENEEAIRRERRREDKSIKVKNKLKSSLETRPLTEKNVSSQREWNREVTKSLKRWRMKLKDPP